MRFPTRAAVTAAVAAGLLGAAAPVGAADPPEPVTVEILASAVREPAVVDSESLIAAMHARYRDTWFPRLTIRQEVIRFEGGVPGDPEIWSEVLVLPGRVRSTIGDPALGNEEIYDRGTQVVLRGGKKVQEAQTVHGVLLLGFDAYVQPPDSTLAALARIPIDRSKFHRAEWDGMPVYVVGAEAGDPGANQFWIEQEHLALVRLITKSPRGNLIDVQLSDLRPVGGGWVAHRLEFRRNGELGITERYLEVGIPDAVDSTLFDLEGRSSP